MSRALALLVLAWPLASWPAFAQKRGPAPVQPTVPLAEILDHVRADRDAVDFRATGRLVHVNAKQERRTFGVSIKAHTFADRTKVMFEVTSPAPSRLRLLIETVTRPGSSGWPGKVMQARPGDPGPRTVDPARWGDTLLETDFSFEDLMDNALLWSKQTLVEEGACGARTCYEIRSEPEPSDQSHYLRVTTWLDRDAFFPVRVEKIFRVSRTTRSFTYFDLRQSKGVWSAGQIEVKTRGRSGSSFLIINRGAEKANLTDDAFDPALLTKP